LFLSAASQLFRLEGVLSLELSTAMFWDVTFGHDCDFGDPAVVESNGMGIIVDKYCPSLVCCVVSVGLNGWRSMSMWKMKWVLESSKNKFLLIRQGV
jgi:hypothetical protein